MRKLYFVLFGVLLYFTTKAQTTVDIYATGTAGSFATGSVNSTGTKNDGDMVTINSTANRGWAKFDLSSIPSGAVVSAATITFTTFSSTSSSATNNVYAFTGDPATMTGTALYTNCGSGTAVYTASWTANSTIVGTINSTGLTFLSDNTGTSQVCLGFVRGSTNTYNIYGYGGTTAQQPKLTITYTVLPGCTGAPTPGTTASTATSVCSTETFNLSVTGATTGVSGLSYQWQSSPTGSSWSDIAGVTTATYNGVSITASTYFRRKITCGTSNDYSQPILVNLSAAATVPYTLDFEAATVPAIPPCTSVENAGSGNVWNTISNPGSGFTSKTLRYAYNTTNAANAWFFTKGISLTGGVSYRVAYKYGNNSTFYSEKLKVAYGDAPASSNMATPLADHPTVINGVATNTYVDFTPTATGIYYIGFNAYSIANQDQLYVDDISVTISPSCGAPTGLTKSAVTSATVQLDWTAPTTGTPPASYSLYFSTNNTAPTSTTAPSIAGITTTTYTLGGLSANTTYYVWVRSKCSASDSSAWSSNVSLQTACLPVTTLPWTEGFEGVTSPAAQVFPSCWSSQTISGTSYPGTSNANDTYRSPRSGNNYIYSQWSHTAWVYSPGIQLTAGVSYDFSFYMMNKNGTAGFTMDVAYGTGATEADMTNVLETAFAANNTSYQQFKYSFTPNATGVYYFGVKSICPSSAPWYLSFDDFKLEVTPSCSEPTGITISNLTNTGLQLDWSAPTVGASPSAYSVYYSTTATTPGLTATPNKGGITSTTLNITGLSGNTTYYIWVRSKCSATDSSSWGGPISVTTPCNPATTFSENFDAVTAGAWPNCWSKVGLGGSAYTQASTAVSSPNNVYIYSGSATSQAVVAMPPVSNADAGTHQLTFKARSNFTAGGIIEVGYLTVPNDAASFVALGSFTTTSTTVIDNFKLSPVQTPPGVSILAFRHTGSPANSVLIDNVVYEAIPACDKPANLAFTATSITTTGVDLSWDPPTAGATPVSYSIYYSTSGTTPALNATPNIAGISNTTYTLSGLTPSTVYYVWVRSKCSASDSSSWSDPVTFTTACVPVATFPWTEGFESVSSPGTGIFPTCWSYEVTTGTTPGTSNANDTYRSPRTGNQYAYTTWSSTAWIYTPSFTLTAGTSYDFSFYMMNKNGTAGFTMDVAYGNTPTSADMTNVLQSAYVAGNTSYQQFKYTFTPNTTGTYTFGIKSTATSAPWYLSFDDFKLETTPACSEPNPITVSAVTANSATVNWVAPTTVTPASYSVYYTTSSTAPALTAAPSIAGVTGTTVNLSGLTGGTTYYVWVRSKCSATDSSSWGGASFVTLPSNDECADALTLVGNTPITGSTIGSTQSQAAETCMTWTGTADDDVWYKFTTTQAGDATVTLTGLNGFDAVVLVYSGTCGSFTTLGCSDLTSATETVNLTGLTANQTYYIRVYSYGNGTASMGTYTLALTGTATVVPVKLTSFTGERRNNTNLLAWVTASELNNAGFELQRSADGTNFSSIGYVKSKAENGNTTTGFTYNFTDDRINLTSTYTYRLKQMDKDGKSTLSQVVMIKGAKATKLELANVYPNPAAEKLNVAIAAPKADNVTFIVTDITGKVVLQQRQQLISGDNLLQLNIQQLGQGTYLLKALCADGCETAIRKFVKD